MTLYYKTVTFYAESFECFFNHFDNMVIFLLDTYHQFFNSLIRRIFFKNTKTVCHKPPYHLYCTEFVTIKFKFVTLSSHLQYICYLYIIFSRCIYSSLSIKPLSGSNIHCNYRWYLIFSVRSICSSYRHWFKNFIVIAGNLGYKLSKVHTYQKLSVLVHIYTPLLK